MQPGQASYSLSRRLTGRATVISDRSNMLQLAWLALGAALLLSPVGRAADGPAEPGLSKLEVKFFQHDYPKETIESRLERLEKMVFGEVRPGSNYERLQNLLAAVPNLSPKVDGEEPADEPDIPGDAPVAGAGTPPGSKGNGPPRQETVERDYMPPQGSKYPAVTAIETRLFGRDYADEPVGKRLDRLEVKLFGKPSGIDDLSERVDRIKQRTGVDIARQVPPGSDWADDDEDTDYYMDQPVAGSGEDGKSFSGRDLRKDMQQAFGIPPGGYMTDRFSSNGSYGMGGSNSRGYSSPPSRTMAPSYGASPPVAPPRAQAPAPVPALGLNDQVAALEQEIFGKTFKDPLPVRLNRLESTVFPQQKPAVDRSLPERVSRLLAVIPLSSQGRQTAQRNKDDDSYDLDDMGMPAPRPAPPRTGSGLSKIINSISGFLSGGFPMAGGGLTTDPQTGLLYDSFTGNLIDPVTGVVVGQRLGPATGFGSFGSGLSPYGATPYGMGSGMGIRFGFGNIGRYGFGF